MIYEIWLGISYMIQLLAACLIFMYPARKRNHYYLRIIPAIIILVMISYWVNISFEADTFVEKLFYWGYYLILCGGFVYWGLALPLKEAVYCAICASAMQHIAFAFYYILEIIFGQNYFLSFFVYVIIYVIFYYFIARNLTSNGRFSVTHGAFFPMVTVILLVWILSVQNINLYPLGKTVNSSDDLTYCMIDALCCFYVLWIQVNMKERLSLQRELDGINNAWNQKILQYQVTKETIENINQKCHDLKHQIRALRCMENDREKEQFLENLESKIMIYDTALNTGNTALDTVLMEKGLFCQQHQIQWSCMADGTKLDFMRLEDIYALFGNALDNAINAVIHVKDIKRRVITVKILTQNNLLLIQIQNYYYGTIDFENGLPLTKQDKKEHGYGMKSMKSIAEKYGGTITAEVKKDVFMLQVLIPIT